MASPLLKCFLHLSVQPGLGSNTTRVGVKYNQGWGQILPGLGSNTTRVGVKYNQGWGQIQPGLGANTTRAGVKTTPGLGSIQTRWVKTYTGLGGNR